MGGMTGCLGIHSITDESWDDDRTNNWAADGMTDRTTGRTTERTTSRTTDWTSDGTTRLPVQLISSSYFSYPIYGGDQTSLAHSSSSVQR